MKKKMLPVLVVLLFAGSQAWGMNKWLRRKQSVPEEEVLKNLKKYQREEDFSGQDFNQNFEEASILQKILAEQRAFNKEMDDFFKEQEMSDKDLLEKYELDARKLEEDIRSAKSIDYLERLKEKFYTEIYPRIKKINEKKALFLKKKVDQELEDEKIFIQIDERVMKNIRPVSEILEELSRYNKDLSDFRVNFSPQQEYSFSYLNFVLDDRQKLNENVKSNLSYLISEWPGKLKRIPNILFDLNDSNEFLKSYFYLTLDNQKDFSQQEKAQLEEKNDLLYQDLKKIIDQADSKLQEANGLKKMEELD